ncbi:hypothetical protein Sjap_013875 [Stephania japonica]|uniref:Protein disulfide isomerase-like 1-4 n=1 Tax=Stephania japonica TaxID=461633 RepID=A0AAP0IYV5_9MAGN
MATRSLLILSIASLLLLTSISSTYSSEQSPNKIDDLDEDLNFLIEQEPDSPSNDDQHHSSGDDAEFEEDEGGEFGSLDDFDASEDADRDGDSGPAVDEKDVVVLKEGNFSEFVERTQFVMVEFYATWCGHCQALAPEYAAAATELKGVAALAKIDATEENDLAQKYDVQGFPTIFFFVDGVHKAYNGPRTKEGIVAWIKKKTGPGVTNVTTIEDAKRILNSEEKLVVGFFDSLVGPESDELSAASRLEDDVNFYQTSSPDVAKLFHLDPKAKRPALVMLKKEAEKLSLFDGQFVKSAIAEFVFNNKLPLVTPFTRESAAMVFENPIKKQLILFATSNNSEKFIPVFEEAAKQFKGKLIFVFVEMDNEDFGRPVSDYFGVSGDHPQVLAYTGNDDAKKFVLNGELSLDNIKAFGKDFLEDKLKPFFKSDSIPETNDGDVKIVVGNSFDDIVLDESKDVLLEIYAPWCGHCQTLEPIYNKLAKHLRGIDSLVIAKMDGTTNEHPRAKTDGFPTLLFFPAGNKSFDPITVETDRTVVAFYKFLKKNASIPFKLQRPAASSKSEDTDATISHDSSAASATKNHESSTANAKDEL